MSTGQVLTLKRNPSLSETMLVPTDGSALSIAAALKAIEFAKRLGARVLALQSIPV